MKTGAVIRLVTLFAMIMLSVIPAQSVTLPDGLGKKLAFDIGMVYGATMVSSGYPNGSMFFGADGSLSCNNYPAAVQCKSWEITSNGQLLRTFTDSHTGAPVEVKAYWKLLSKSGSTLQVSQTSSNSPGETIVTVTVR
jgi:hypothetical protein